MIKAVIFDLDNTLLDFMKMKSRAVDSGIQGMIEAGLSIESNEARQKIFNIYDTKGYEYQEVFDDLIISELGEINYKILASGIVAYKKAKEASLILYPNVLQTINQLSKMGLKLGVVSDAPSREAWIRLCTVNLHHIFDAVVTFHDTGFHKPSPEPFKKIVERLNIAPKECIMVGDWPARDVVGASKVGMKTAFAKYGDTFDTVDSGADYDLETITELVHIVDRENK